MKVANYLNPNKDLKEAIATILSHLYKFKVVFQIELQEKIVTLVVLLYNNIIVQLPIVLRKILVIIIFKQVDYYLTTFVIVLFNTL